MGGEKRLLERLPAQVNKKEEEKKYIDIISPIFNFSGALIKHWSTVAKHSVHDLAGRATTFLIIAHPPILPRTKCTDILKCHHIL